MEANDLLIAHMEDLSGKAVKTGCAASRFLTPAEAQSVSAHFMCRHEASLSFDGGYEAAERVRAIFLNPDWGTYDSAGYFAALLIRYRAQDTPGHRGILGALMALGIQRDTIGDITIDNGVAGLICMPEISGYIAENLTRAGRVGLKCAIAGLDELPEKAECVTIKTDTVASLRLDAVLCAAYGFSRARAAELLQAGLCSLNHATCTQSAREVSEGATLSVRGFGRAKLIEIGGVSRKSRIFIKIGLYGR